MLITRHVYQTRMDKLYSWLFILPVAAVLMIAATIVSVGFRPLDLSGKLNEKNSRE